MLIPLGVGFFLFVIVGCGSPWTQQGLLAPFFFVWIRKTKKSMIYNIWNAISRWLSNRRESNELIRAFNNDAKNSFIQGNTTTLLESKRSKGNKLYKHKFSNRSYSGFRIKVFADKPLTKEDITNIGENILNDDVLVRKLIVLGFDTLEVHGEVDTYGCRWQLKKHI